MTTATTQKERVINYLVKRGSNVENATTWVNEHYDYAAEYYTGVAKIARVIMSL